MNPYNQYVGEAQKNVNLADDHGNDWTAIPRLFTTLCWVQPNARCPLNMDFRRTNKAHCGPRVPTKCVDICNGTERGEGWEGYHSLTAWGHGGHVVVG